MLIIFGGDLSEQFVNLESMNNPKKTRRRFRDVFTFLIILLITTYLLPQGSMENSCIILPAEISPYKTAELKSKDLSVKLKYPQEIHGELLGDEQFGIVKLMLNGKFYYVSVRLLLKKTAYRNDKPNIPIGEELVDIETPLPHDYKPNDLIKIDQKWNYHAADYSKYLRKEAAEALTKLFTKANKEGLSLKVVSAFRAFSKQRQLYLKAIKKNGLEQNIVAKPGHSEHQLGTTVDVSAFTPESVLNESFAETKEGKWMKANANKYGFYQSYTINNSEVTGYIPEPWHYRYIGTKK